MSFVENEIGRPPRPRPDSAARTAEATFRRPAGGPGPGFVEVGRRNRLERPECDHPGTAAGSGRLCHFERRITNHRAVPYPLYPSDFGHGSYRSFCCPGTEPIYSLQGEDLSFDVFPFRAKLRDDSCHVHEFTFLPVHPSRLFNSDATVAKPSRPPQSRGNQRWGVVYQYPRLGRNDMAPSVRFINKNFTSFPQCHGCQTAGKAHRKKLWKSSPRFTAVEWHLGDANGSAGPYFGTPAGRPSRLLGLARSVAAWRSYRLLQRRAPAGQQPTGQEEGTTGSLRRR